MAVKTLVVSRDRITNDADKFVGNTRQESDRQLRYRSFEDRTRLRYERVWDGERAKLTLGGSLEAVGVGVDMWALKGRAAGVDTTNLQTDPELRPGRPLCGLCTAFRQPARHLEPGAAHGRGQLQPEHGQSIWRNSPRGLPTNTSSASHWTANSHVGPLPADARRHPPGGQPRDQPWPLHALHHDGPPRRRASSTKTARPTASAWRCTAKRYRNAPFLVNDQIAYANAIGAYVAVGDQPSIPEGPGPSPRF